MIKKIQTGITTPKARVFILFLCCSLGAWLISRLSQTYTHTISIPVAYENAPDSLILVSSPPTALQARLRTSGFQLLRYQISPKPVNLDLSKAGKNGTRLYVSPESCRTTLQGQLDDAVSLLSVLSDTLRFDFQALKSKTVPIQPNVTLEMAQNFMLDGALEVDPPKIHILGPPGEIDTLQFLWTESLNLSDVREDFEQELRIEGISGMPNSKLSKTAVRIRGKVYRFSEVIVEVPIEVEGVPQGVDIRTFPDRVGLLCKGKIEVLKNLDSTDFRVMADFNKPDPDTGRLPLTLVEHPEAVSSTDLLESSVEFIVRRE